MIKSKVKNFWFTFTGFCLFFLTIGVSSTFSIIIYYMVTKSTNYNLTATIFAVLGVIFICAMFCCVIDLIRRKTMIERPIKLILEATEKISSGNFNVKLVPLHDYKRYDYYDSIFDNISLMAAELSRNEVLKNDFISNVSHEIKTPLAVIQNYTKTLQNNSLSKEKKQECLKALNEQTQKLSNLISNILKLNKLENQKIVPEIETVDLAELLRVSVLQFENLFEEKFLQVECDIDELSLKTYPSMLEIVFNNLISNAIKFTDENGKITISLKQQNNYAIIKITDTGCGISSQTGKHIFDKFYQGDTSRSKDGNGLGLALVKKVISLIGGEISVESKVGVGSTFTVKLKKEM